LTTDPGPSFIDGDPSAVTDSDVHALAGEFLNSGYRGDEYANWPIERRLDGFLRRRGLSRHANDGDVCNVIIDRIMTRASGSKATISVEGRHSSSWRQRQAPSGASAPRQ
jgi:hypothetical protein